MAVRQAIAPLAGGGGEFGRFRPGRLHRRGSQPRVGRQPAVDEALDPAVERRIVERMHGQMHATLLGARQFQALGGFHGPDLFHLQGDLGMKLEAEGVVAVAKGLDRVGLVGRQKLAARRDPHALAVPLVDLHRRFDPFAAGFGRLDVDVANLDLALGMRAYPAAGGAGQQLGAEAKAEEWHARLDHLGNPVQLALDAGQRAAIVGRHRTAENHHAGIVGHVFRQVAAEVGAEAVELVTALLEEGADPTGPRMLLVHDDRYPFGGNLFGLFSQYRHGFARYASVVATTRRTNGGETKWRASSTSTSTAPAPGRISPFTPSSRWRPSSARKSPGSPSWSAACSMPSTRPSTTAAPSPTRASRPTC